jgi:uncharacterized protein (TIGR02265 family)
MKRGVAGREPAGLGAEQELKRSLALATPADSVRGMFFRSVMEVMRALGDEAAVERCVEACGERRFVDFTCYPTASFLRLLWSAAGLLENGYGSFEGALRALGRRGATDFLSSSTGRPLQALLLGNPKRLLESLPMAYAVASANGGRCTVTFGAPGNALIILERDFLPREYVEGALATALEVVGTREPRVRGRSTGPLSVEYMVSWK